MKKLITLLMLMSFLTCSFFISAQTRVACVGNSITEGFGLQNPSIEAWPARLGEMLGSKYTVLNCGVSGTTMLKKGDSPYWNTSKFNDAKNFNPDILIISLGTNDARPNNWVYKSDFYNDYLAMIDAFRQSGRNPVIYICFPPAIYGDTEQISNLQNELIPMLRDVRSAKGVTIIDYNSPTQNQRNTLYNDNLHPNAAGALVLANVAFNSITPAVPVFYQHCTYGGYAIKLGVGEYNLGALNAKGIYNDDISSIHVPSGYKITAYWDDNFAGTSITLTERDDCLFDNGWNDKISSIKIFANGVTGMNGTYSLQNRNSSKYMDVAGNGNPADGTNILQWNGTGGTNQQFTFTDEGNGAYKIICVATGKAVDVAEISINNVANVHQWTYLGSNNQKFILMAIDNGYYKLKALHSGRIIEVYAAGTNAGDNINQYDDNNQPNGHWRLAAPGSLRTASTLDSRELQNDFERISIFPNPATDIITLTNIPANTKITVFNLCGQAVLQQSSPAENGDVIINISHLNTGPYFLKTGNVKSKTLKLFKR